MENISKYINKEGLIRQPQCYNDFGEVEFRVEDLIEDEKYLHIKGEVGYLNKDLEKIQHNKELEIKLSRYDGVEFYFKYNKENNIIEVGRHFRTTTCEEEEYNKFAGTWYYDKEIGDFNTGLHFPYFRLVRSKDAVLIPHFVRALWKSEDMPKIYLDTKLNS